MSAEYLNVRGSRIRVTRSYRKGKKFKAEVPFNSKITANDLSRAKWRCKN